ncbi:MAG: aldehyde ferredoxin oxidoreductase, partial [Oscillospiraceae bacterium]|nr:aldehyde ferredoxin oxidoreductase [Oscillospiraceae bacterium]
MSGAYYEKIARINLSTGEIKVEPLDLETAHKFIGGRGLGTKILYDEGVATVDPLSADNKLIYITGPMTGSNTPSSGRYMVVTKSPLTGMIACANSGGIWGAKLKFAGWDALIVEGVAPEWSYLYIEDDKIQIFDATEYLGMLSEEFDDKLKEKHGAECSVLNIGPAGEKQVLLSCVM